MALIRFIFWAILFLAATFAFIVLFEHGPANFVENAKAEAGALQALLGKPIERKTDESTPSTPPNR